MVQRRPKNNTPSMNPFDSDDDSPPKAKNPSPYTNPFDDDEPPQPPQRNPFDDEAMWNRRHENAQKSSKISPPASKVSTSADNYVEEVGRPRRQEKVSKVSASTDNYVEEVGRPRRQEKGSKVSALADEEVARPRRRDSPPAVSFLEDNQVEESRPRRRDKVREKISSISDDVASKASRGIEQMRPRSKNLMGSSQNRQLLLEEDDSKMKNDVILTEQKRFTHARIETGLRAGQSLEDESVQELEEYGLKKAEETTQTAYNALRVAEDIKESATNTAIMLHEQGQQITRTHDTAVTIDHELSRGEKLLGSLGGLFSKTWKPKKTRNITGPILTRGDSFKRKAYGMEQRQALGLNKNVSPRARARGSNVVSADSSGSQFQSRVKNEFAKQDDALADLSNVLDQLKGMSIDMGEEIGRQNGALGHLEGDVTELGDRVRGANERGRRLLGR